MDRAPSVKALVRWRSRDRGPSAKLRCSVPECLRSTLSGATALSTACDSDSRRPRGSHVSRGLVRGAYVNGLQVGHLAAWLHSDNAAFIKMIDVDERFQRRGIASTLYETLFAERPGLLVEHGHRTSCG